MIDIAMVVRRQRSRPPSRAARSRATQVIERTLARIARRDAVLNAFTAVTAERALARAATTADRAVGGVPFAVKNLIDIAGLPTLAGSKINREHPPARADATLVARLEAAGAILVGALNMGEYAYDFTGENSHDGPSRNPHDTDAHDRRFVRRIRRRRRRRSGADRARLRHQRFDPRAVVVLRHLRTEADLWPAVARRQLSVRVEPRSPRSVRAQHGRSGAGLRRDDRTRSARSGLHRSGGRTSRCRARHGHRRAAHCQCRRLLSCRRRPGGAGRAGQRRQGAWRDAADRIARGRAGARRRLCHHHIRRCRLASASSAHPCRATSIPTCATG